MRKDFEEQLYDLKVDLVAMCRIVQSMIKDAIRALVTHDKALALSIQEIDRQVNEYEMTIEKKCMRLLLKQQPVARDFREVSTTLKMITDIERIGDQAADIGNIVAGLEDDYIGKVEIIPRMGELAEKMVHDSVSSFIQNNTEIANKTIAVDKEMNELFIKVKEELIGLIKEDGKKNADQAIMFMMIAKYLERIGDHAKNVCEWTNFFETGIRKDLTKKDKK